MKPLAILLVALAACVPALAQELEPPDEPSSAVPDPQAERPARTPRLGRVAVEWRAPPPLVALFRRHLPPPEIEEGERRAASLRPWIRDVRRRVPEIAGSEGYFSPMIDIDPQGEDRERVVITVTPGARTTVGDVEITFRGDLALEGAEREARRRRLREAWTLKPGAPFRSADWDVAKTRLHEDLTQDDYAAGELAESEAVVDADAARANLKLVLDSGPMFTLGDVQIEGIDKYTEAVVRRVVDLRRGERYSAARLEELQRRVQEGPWFSSVVVEVARDRTHPELCSCASS